MSKKSLLPRLARTEQKQRSNDRLTNILLTAIIKANPHHDPTVKDETRLARAREALLGEPNSRGRKSTRDDLLLFPVYEAAFRVENDKMKRALLSFQDQEVRDEWVKQLEKDVGALSLTSADMADLEGLVAGDSPKAERLKRILADLEAVGIRSQSPFRTEIDDLNPDTE